MTESPKGLNTLDDFNNPEGVFPLPVLKMLLIQHAEVQAVFQDKLVQCIYSASTLRNQRTRPGYPGSRPNGSSPGSLKKIGYLTPSAKSRKGMGQPTAPK